MGELVGPDFEGERGAGESGVEAKGCYAAAAFVDEEFEVEEGAASSGEPGEDVFPAGLVLVAVGELDVDVLEGD